MTVDNSEINHYSLSISRDDGVERLLDLVNGASAYDLKFTVITIDSEYQIEIVGTAYQVLELLQNCYDEKSDERDLNTLKI